MKMAEDMPHIDVAYAGLSDAPFRALTKALIDTANGIEKNKQARCAHFLGYLKTRPKGSSIPDECLTCATLMKCMQLFDAREKRANLCLFFVN